jgi:hypothetical protein
LSNVINLTNRGAGNSAWQADRAEIIPFEPDPDNAGVGIGNCAINRSHILSGQRGMALMFCSWWRGLQKRFISRSESFYGQSTFGMLERMIRSILGCNGSTSVKIFNSRFINHFCIYVIAQEIKKAGIAFRQ